MGRSIANPAVGGLYIDVTPGEAAAPALIKLVVGFTCAGGEPPFTWFKKLNTMVL
jgi:hypothetical protein